MICDLCGVHFDVVTVHDVSNDNDNVRKKEKKIDLIALNMHAILNAVQSLLQNKIQVISRDNKRCAPDRIVPTGQPPDDNHIAL